LEEIIMHISKAFRWTMIIVCLAFILVQPGKPAMAAPTATITVNSSADVVAKDGDCTLREAIQNANANSRVNDDCTAGFVFDQITFSTGLHPITLTSALPAITDNLTIDGSPGIGATQAINGNNVYRIFETEASNVTLKDLIFTNGSTTTQGGAIYNSGGLTIDHCTFMNNAATGQGGAIYHTGTSFTVSFSTFTNNESTGASGGAIKTDHSASITNSEFNGNQADSEGGALVFTGYSYDIFTVSDSLFEDNQANYGGGISSHNAITITNSTFNNNASSNYGGGLLINLSYPDEHKAVVQDSTFTDNQAEDFHGGGIYNATGPLELTNSTFYSNTAGERGGALAIWSGGYLTATHTTISNNGGIEAFYTPTSSQAKLMNSIIANSTGKNCSNDTPIDGGGNLQYGGSVDASCGASVETGDPRLGELADNGGDTLTMMLLHGSAALDQISGANGCGAGVTTDQRGVTRPINTLCDIGAVENEVYIYLPLIIK
jgi:CSLREA domain-containing protein